MKTFLLFIALAIFTFANGLRAATTVTSTATAVATVIPTNTAIIPALHVGKRTDDVLQHAKENPGACDVAFIGDSITQGWEGSGKPVWEKYYGRRKCLNFGVGGDRTQHVLWRFEHGQLDGLKPKAAVLMIGTNNSDDTEADILEGVQAIVKQMRERQPRMKIIVLGIFPRAQTFSPVRGKLLQVNQALAKLADGKMVHYVDFGSQLIEGDGSISKDIMPDFLHLSERGYEIWAQAIEPKLKILLAK